MLEISHATACVVSAAVALCLVMCVVAAVVISWIGRVEWCSRGWLATCMAGHVAVGSTWIWASMQVVAGAVSVQLVHA